MLLIEVDGDEYAIEKNASDIRRICEGCSALRFISAGDKKEADRLWEARREASPSLYDLRPHKVSEDVVIPRSKMGELVSFLDDMGRRYDLPIAAFGHAGDGNLHVNIMHDRNRSGELEKVEAAVKDLFNRVLQLGGTITGEHGIGITKAPYLEMEISRAGLELMGRIKNAFDPKGILNPGKIFI